MNSRWTQSLEGSRRRMAAEVYWKIRNSASCVREWMTLFYSGSRHEQRWKDLWLIAESTDLTLAQAYAQGGYPMVCGFLDTDDRLEHWMSRLAGEIAYLRTGEEAILEQLSTSQAPGESDLAPQWSLAGARDTAKALYLQKGRVNNASRGGGGQGSDDDNMGPKRRPRRRPKAPPATQTPKKEAGKAAGPKGQADH